MSLLARFLSPLRRERVADRLLDVGRPTIAEIFRDGRVKVTACAHTRWQLLYDIPVCAHCGAKLE